MVEETQDLLRLGVSNLFCSSPCVLTVFKGTSPSYLNHRNDCPFSLFDLYLPRCLFCCRSGLYFDKCSLAVLPSLMARRFTLARDEPKRRMVRGLLPSCHSCSSKPIISCLASLPAKTSPGHSHSVGQALAALPHLATSLPNLALYP